MNIANLLKDCSKGTKLWSPICGDCTLIGVDLESIHCITVRDIDKGIKYSFNQEGCFYDNITNSECILFPSRDQRDWSKFNPNKFYLEQLEVFDSVLYRNDKTCIWKASFISYIQDDDYYVMGEILPNYIIPWNEDTKHLWNTTDEAPEQYKWWK